MTSGENISAVVVYIHYTFLSAQQLTDDDDDDDDAGDANDSGSRSCLIPCKCVLLLTL